jgi:hypothetical protein
MGAELGSAISELASKGASLAKEYLPKIFDNELTRIAVTSGEKSIRKTGPWGDVLVDSVKKFQDDSAQQSGQYYSEMLKAMKPFMKDRGVTKDIATHWQNHANLPDGPLKDAITTAKMHRLNIYTQMQKAGIKVGPMVEDDFPRMYDPKLFEGVNRNESIARLQSQGMSIRQAESLLDNISGRGSKAHNYETPRKWDLPGYRRDIGVLFDDIDKGAKRLNFAKIFGPNEENMDMMMKGIHESSGNFGRELATRYMDGILKQGKYYRGVRPWEQGLASLQVASKLSLAVLSHTSQPLNLAVYAGIKAPVKALASLVHELVENGNVASGEDFALRSGATWTESMRRYKELYGSEVGGLGSKILHATGFVSLDKYRRIFASVTGKYLAEDLWQELREGVRPDVARSKLSQMGIDVEKALKRGSLSEDDVLQAAKRTSDVTQFTFDANQLPMAWKSSPSARLVMQFKQYFYAQANFIKDFALKPAVQYLQTGGASGEIKPLIYMSILFPTFGELTADLREVARKGTLEERPQSPMERLVDNAAHAGAFGIFQDLVYNIASPSDKPIWHFVAGPTISDFVDLARLPQTKQPIGEELLRRVPIVGPVLSHSQHESSRKHPRKKGFLEGGGITKFIDSLSSQ